MPTAAHRLIHRVFRPRGSRLLPPHNPRAYPTETEHVRYFRASPRLARARKRRRRDRSSAGQPAALPRRLPHARCGGRRALRRQGAQPEKARRQLHPVRPSRRTPAPHGVGDVRAGNRHHAHRGRSAAAGGQSHQAPEAALQHRSARRQILSVADAGGGSPRFHRSRSIAVPAPARAPTGARSPVPGR